MRNLQTAVSATITAIVIGLLVANIASAARAADIEHTKQAKIAALEASAGANDTALQLQGYQQRYTEAYNQMVAAYNALQQRDAAWAALWNQSQGTSAQLEASNAALEARLLQAYQLMQQAQYQLNALGGTPQAPVVVSAPTGNAPVTAPATTGPVANTPATPKPATGPVAAQPTPPVTTPPAPSTPQLYCWYDADGKWVCEDHPRGQ